MADHTPEARSPESHQELRAALQQERDFWEESAAEFGWTHARDSIPRQRSAMQIEALLADYDRVVSQLDAQAARVRELEQDAERLDWIGSWLKGDTIFCPPGNHGGEIRHWLCARQDDSKSSREGMYSEDWEGPTLRAAIDAARGAARTQEGK